MRIGQNAVFLVCLSFHAIAVFLFWPLNVPGDFKVKFTEGVVDRTYADWWHGALICVEICIFGHPIGE